MKGKNLNKIFTLSFMVGIGLLLSNSIALPLQQHHANLDSNSINSNANLENSTNYQTSYDTSLLSSGTNAGWASSKPFSVMGGSFGNFGYRENGFIMSSGYNRNGGLGIGTSGSSTNVGEPFALYKEGNYATPFYNAIDYSIGHTSGIIDSTGKLYTSGYGYYGQLGNGYSTNTDQDGNKVPGYLGDYGSGTNQYSFQQVITRSSDKVSEANKANALPDDYQSLGISAGHDHQITLLSDGTLYGAGVQSYIGLSTSTTAQTHFTRLDGRATNLPAATASNKIKDIAAAASCSWVLYENGELYMTANTASYGATPGAYTLVASDIKFFDCTEQGAYVYAVNTSNQILSAEYRTPTLTALVANPNGTVTQVRGSQHGGWGYLNSNNELYLSTTAEGVVPGASNNTQTGTTFYKMDNVAFFDLGGESSKMTYGVMYTNGNMTVWGDNTYGQLGNGSVGNPDPEAEDYVPSTPETGAKPEVEFAPEDIPNVEDDVFTGPEDVEFDDKTPIIPISFIPPASFLNI